MGKFIVIGKMVSFDKGDRRANNPSILSGGGGVKQEREKTSSDLILLLENGRRAEL